MPITITGNDAGATRTSLGLGDASTKTVGVANGNVLAADATGIPAINGSQVTALNASNLGSGTVPTARLGSGTANSSTFLRGDGSWAEAGGGAWSVKTSGTFSSTAALEVTSLTKTTSLWFTNVKLSNDGGFLPIVTLSSDNGSSYITTTTYDYRNGPSGTLSTSQGNWSLGDSSFGAASDEGFSGWFTIFDPNQAVAQTNALWNLIGQDTGGTLRQTNGGGIHKAALDIDAFKFGNSSTVTFASGKFVVLELN
jgi:hypothetical protein